MFLFTSSSGTCLSVTWSTHMCQCIFLPGFVRLGFLLPIEPRALWNLEPTLHGPQEKLCLFIAHAKPLPFETQMTFTISTPSRISTPTASPSFMSENLFDIGTSLMIQDSTISRTTASYPSLSCVLICAIFVSGTLIRVTGISASHLAILVISNFFQMIQAIFKKINDY